MTTEAVTTTTEETLAQEEQEAKEFKSLVGTSTVAHSCATFFDYFGGEI